MSALATTAFGALVQPTTGPCVSIVLPVDRRHPDDRRDHLALKNLLASARRQLEAAGTPHVDSLLEPVEAVLARTVIAEHSGSLALYAAPGRFAEHLIDATAEPFVAVSDHFALTPLVPGLDGGVRCHVLTVGATQVALHRVDGTGWTACDVPGLPTSVDDALWYERTERMSGAHAGGPAGNAMSIVGHGSGGQDEDRKERLARFFRLLDDAVNAFLHTDADLPLVVAGTAPVVARYQTVSRHRHLVAAPVGSPEELASPELRRRVEDVLIAETAGDADPLLAELAARLGTGLASTDLDEIVAAAGDGRVRELLIATEATTHPDADGRTSRAIAAAWTTGAALRVVPGERLPGGSDVAALFRY